jgi:hypothetical protein
VAAGERKAHHAETDDPFVDTNRQGGVLQDGRGGIQRSTQLRHATMLHRSAAPRMRRLPQIEK